MHRVSAVGQLEACGDEEFVLDWQVIEFLQLLRLDFGFSEVIRRQHGEDVVAVDPFHPFAPCFQRVRLAAVVWEEDFDVAA